MEEFMEQTVQETAPEVAAEPVQETAPETPPEGPAEPEGRDFADEVRDLLHEFPDAWGTQLPEEVVRAAAGGQRTVDAYRDWRIGQGFESQPLVVRQVPAPSRVERQNAVNAARAPVSGTSSGFAVTDPAWGRDSFMDGFED